MSITPWSRRQMLGIIGASFGGAIAAHAQSTGRGGAPSDIRIAPMGELVNVPEFGGVAKQKLSDAVFATIAPEDRQAMDLITLRPRMLVNTMDLDLAVQVFGTTIDTPMIIGATPDQKRFHPDGELATVRGAAAAKVPMIVSSRSSVPLEQLAAQAKTPLWFQISSDEPNAGARVRQAVQAGCKAVCISAAGAGAARRIDWAAIDQLRQGVTVPVLVSGVTTPDEAKLAVQHSLNGMVVTRLSGPPSVKGSPIAMLPAIADAAAGNATILMEDTAERGQDIFKALALGATAVIVTRPAMWGLAAYGPEGIESVFTMLMTELAKVMSACGKVNVKALDRTAVKIHAGVPKTISR